MIFADLNTEYFLLTDGENLQVILAVSKDGNSLPDEIKAVATRLAPNTAKAFIADGMAVHFFSGCLVPLSKAVSPKQATKALSGAAVSSLPFHVADVPLEKAVTAEYMANHARNEAKKSLRLSRGYRLGGDHQEAVFLLNDAAEFRRVYQAFTKAIDVMGGL
ncbi:hypothetical protein [Photobacterium sanguinicancri]|uniref:hypothetical protein n=1 Tax=Photobacterium sanguinicancri TaxID=875932 RepID=UPI0026E19291|nr:hypothetical protein [Photobacterium sanguinicancri]MDO6496849.1 hypothetical protein [Photobacterium sanguinicancri]